MAMALAVSAHAARVLPIPAAPIDGRPVTELSGLAWDAESGELMAVSDRGHWLRWRIELTPDRRLRLVPRAAGAIASRRVNAEAVTAIPGRGPQAGWWVVDENRHRIVELARDGTPRGERAMPGGLPVRPRGVLGGARSHGVEAVAWHPRHGLIAALQKPQDGAFELHADDGLLCRVPVTPGSKQALKDMHRIDERRLLLLERLESRGRRRVLLRTLDPSEPEECAAPVAELELDLSGLPAEVNLEGLTCIDNRHCLVVNDDDGRPGGSWLLLVELPERPDQRQNPLPGVAR
jgi:Esterase-like activity of phytase